MRQDEWDWNQVAQALWKHKVLLIAGPLVCMAVAWIVSLLLPRTYETSFSLRIGIVANLPLDESYVVARRIEAASNGRAMASLDKQSAPDVVLVRVRAGHPDQALSLAQELSGKIIESHRVLFDQKMQKYLSYEESLFSEIRELATRIDSLQETMNRISKEPNVEPSTILLIESQIVEHTTRLIGFRRELRDLQIQNSRLHSRNTEVLTPPVLPVLPVRPRTVLNVLAAGIAGFFICVTVAALLGSQK